MELLSGVCVGLLILFGVAVGRGCERQDRADEELLRTCGDLCAVRSPESTPRIVERECLCTVTPFGFGVKP